MKKFRSISIVLVVVLMITLSGPVFAVSIDDGDTTVNADAIIMEEFGTLFSREALNK